MFLVHPLIELIIQLSYLRLYGIILRPNWSKVMVLYPVMFYRPIEYGLTNSL